MTEGKDIKEMWAWVSLDEHGNEAIPAFKAPSGAFLPCIGATREKIESLRPMILMFVMPLRPVKLVRFKQRKTVEVLRYEQPLDS
jgi:hypothetical protein